jgi:hypothetical protein
VSTLSDSGTETAFLAEHGGPASPSLLAAEAANLRTTVQGIYGLLKRGRLRRMPGKPGRLLFQRQDLDDYLNRAQHRSSMPKPQGHGGQTAFGLSCLSLVAFGPVRAVFSPALYNRPAASDNRRQVVPSGSLADDGPLGEKPPNPEIIGVRGENMR